MSDTDKQNQRSPEQEQQGSSRPRPPRDPREQAIKYKAFRHTFSEKEIRKGLDDKAIHRKIRRSQSLAGRYRQYVEMLENGDHGRIYPWQNPFNRFLFWTAYWAPRLGKWGLIALLALFVINYLPGPTQHVVELLVARTIYDTAPIKRLPASLETYAHSANIVDAHGAIIKSYGKRRVTATIPVLVQKAVLACEDHYLLPHPNNPWYVNRFLIHAGVSWPNLAGAVLDTLRGVRRGASTIVMQNAKKILGNSERTLGAKLEEIIISYLMVSRFGKEQNLNFYINTVPVGANIYGFPAAAASYFKKDLSELNYQQLVAIGSFIPNHNRQVAFYEIIGGKSLAELEPALQRHARQAINKINLALGWLHRLGEINDAQYRRWLLSDEESIRSIGFRDFRSPLYGEEEWTSWEVIKEVTSRSYQVDGRRISGSQLILDQQGDVVIETGVNLALVEKIKATVAGYLASPAFRKVLRRANAANWRRDLALYQRRGLSPPYHDFNGFMNYLYRHLNVGVMAVDQQGKVVAYVGGKEFFHRRDPEPAPTATGTEPDHQGNSDQVLIDLMNRRARIAPSSTIKPVIAYFAMVAAGFKPESTFADRPLEYKYLESEGRQVWLPRNWYPYDPRGSGHNRYLGRRYSLFEAQVLSINTIFARLYTNRQIRNAVLVAFDKIGLDYNREDARYWPFGIGASGLPVQQWLGVYNAFLDGNYRSPSFVSRITINGKVIYERRRDQALAPVPLFDARRERDAEMRVLYEVCNRGTAAAMKKDFKFYRNLVSGKTGTAPDERSALFISHFNPYRDRQAHADHNLTMMVAVTTNTGGDKSVGTSNHAPVAIAGRVYDYLFQNELQRVLDAKIEAAKQNNIRFRNNHVYWGNVDRYLDRLLNGKCGKRFIRDSVIGIDGFGEALDQILNSNNKIYTGRDRIFEQLVQYYCDQGKMVK